MNAASESPQALFSLADKVCVVTGGSRGLGYYMAKAFLQAGAARVYITARKAEACEQAAQELSAFGECIAVPGNISSMEEGRFHVQVHHLVPAFFRETVDAFQTANAGVVDKHMHRQLALGEQGNQAFDIFH